MTTTKLDTAIAEMKAATEKLKTSTEKLNAATEKRLATLLASAHGREAVLTMQRLGIDLPEGGGFVSAAAVDRAIAKLSVSQRLQTKVLLARVGILA